VDQLTENANRGEMKDNGEPKKGCIDHRRRSIHFERIQPTVSEKGYEVNTAGTGKEAIKKVNERFFDIALIDIRLPDMSGTDLLLEAGENFSKTVKNSSYRPSV